MKQLIGALLTLVLCIGLCACGNSTPAEESAGDNAGDAAQTTTTTTAQETPKETIEALKCSDSIDNENFTMTFESVELLDEYSYSTSEYSSTSLYVEEGYKLVLVKGHFTNNSTAAISDSAFAREALVNETYKVDGFDVRMNFIRDKNFEIDAYTDLDYVLYINIPEKLAAEFETVTFTLRFNKDMSAPTTVYNSDGTKTIEADFAYALTSGLTASSDTEEKAEEPAAKTIAIGEMVTTTDYEFTLKNVELTYEVLPSDVSSVYSSYVADSGKVYVHVEADIKNIMQRDLRINELFDPSILYDGKYPYTGFVAVDDNNRFDWVGSYVAATPLETCTAHGIIECPVEVDTSGNSIVVSLEIGETTYEYVLR